MDITEIRKKMTEQERTIKDVLNQYVKEHGCPCAWEQFEYWVRKQQGGGWQDNIQNSLVKHALSLPCFNRLPLKPYEYEDNFEITCTNCGREWRYISEEWRMLAFHERLIPIAPKTLIFPQFVGSSVFATTGFEPTGVESLSLSQWAEFMLGRPYEPTSGAFSDPLSNESSVSILQRLRTLFRGHI